MNPFSFSGPAAGVVPPGSISYSEIQNVSAQYVLLGRQSSGAGSIEEIVSSAAVFTMLGSNSAAAIRSNIGAINIAGDTMTGALVINFATAPQLELISESSSAQQRFNTYSNTASDTANFVTRRGRGTASVPLALNQNDAVGQWVTNAYLSGAFSSISFFRSIVTATTPSSTARDAAVFLQLGNGSTISEMTRWDWTAGLSMYGASNVVIDANRVFRNRVLTVGTLPAGVQGMMTSVNDSLDAPVYNAAAVGGGVVYAKVTYTGAAWVYG